MDLNFENIYNILSIALTFLFSFYMLFHKTEKRFSNVFIGLFVLYIGLESIEVLLTKNSFYSNHFPSLYLIIPNLAFLIYPLFFFYIKSITFKDFKIKRIHFLHVIPYIIVVLISTNQYYIQDKETQLYIMSGNELPWFIGLMYYGLRIQGIVYMILSIRLVYRFKKIVNENYSSIDKRNYKWILHLTYVFVYFVLGALVYNIIRFYLDNQYTYISLYISSLISLGFLLWLIYKVMSQPQLFNGIDANIKLLKEYLKEKERNQNTVNNKEINLDLKLKLENHMSKTEAFSNPSLTIFDLATDLNLTSTELSLFLNRSLNKTFFDFINEYRINKAKEILIDPSKKDFTILEILYEVGFNSKSSFNTAFKKYTNQTPTQFRNSFFKKNN
jgi:AraC-like DNA-binding protein